MNGENNNNEELRNLNPYERRRELERRVVYRMQLAIRYGMIEEIQKLLDNPIIQSDLDGFVYHVACWGNREVAEYFFNLPGIDINGGEGGSCMTPLKEAMRANNMETFEVLLSHPNINVNTSPCRGFGQTALQYALLHPNDEFAKRLLARPEIQVDDKTLDMFVARGKTNMLIESGSHKLIARLFARHPDRLPKHPVGILANRAWERRRQAVSAWAEAHAAQAAAEEAAGKDEGAVEAAGGAGAATPARNNANTRNNGNGKRNNRQRRNTRRARKH